MHLDQPEKRTLVVEFSSKVHVVGGGEWLRGRVRGDGLHGVTRSSMEELVDMGKTLAGTYHLLPLEESFQ